MRGLSIRNEVLLYKLLIRPMMDDAFPIWRPAVRTHVERLQMFQSKGHRIAAGAPWYIDNRQSHEYL
jgi:hypothetical protein